MKSSTAQSLLSKTCNVHVHELVNQGRVEAIIDKSLGFNQSVLCQNLQVLYDDDGSCIIEGTARRTDWKKDALTQTSEHPFRMVVSRDDATNSLNYNCQSSIPETKRMMSAIQRNIHRELVGANVVREEEVLKVITRHFKKDADIFSFLMEFTKSTGGSLEFVRLENIQAGLTKKRIKCPEQFAWLGEQVDVISLHGTNLESSDIIGLGKIGILVFGEVVAYFQFNIDSIVGSCVVRYGFPNYFSHGKQTTEFEVRIQSLTLASGFESVSREKLRADITAYFMNLKSSVFDRYIRDDVVDIKLRDDSLQYKISVDTIEGE